MKFQRPRHSTKFTAQSITRDRPVSGTNRPLPNLALLVDPFAPELLMFQPTTIILSFPLPSPASLGLASASSFLSSILSQGPSGGSAQKNHNNMPSTRFVDIDPNGDLYLQISDSDCLVRVSRQTLAAGSPYFAALSGCRNDWREASIINTGTSLNPARLPVPETDEDALTAMCQILHSQQDQVRINNPKSIVRLLALANHWICGDAVHAASSDIFRQMVDTESNDGLGLLVYAAHVMDDAEFFSKFTHRLVGLHDSNQPNSRRVIGRDDLNFVRQTQGAPEMDIRKLDDELFNRYVHKSDQLICAVESCMDEVTKYLQPQFDHEDSRTGQECSINADVAAAYTLGLARVGLWTVHYVKHKPIEPIREAMADFKIPTVHKDRPFCGNPFWGHDNEGEKTNNQQLNPKAPAAPAADTLSSTATAAPHSSPLAQRPGPAPLAGIPATPSAQPTQPATSSPNPPAPSLAWKQRRLQHCGRNAFACSCIRYARERTCGSYVDGQEWKGGPRFTVNS
ncbi:hypothetical protein M409DRAFT_56994 [Zasmidium cellare ATCC 36951]|uniref:BTB domain-containing protein n=1 Tax=Zasmidium cellare ATCC 36951 TaxID=1080233 RepID=A0A6A6C9R1_ZASCE|nr:uncharacterized protein M409DRAFT_56994 [Zasmidium cellare ATCC 36951]KAF2163884.1 hypothetical protein M409DRAFT_56994 [Zasmidium cellare ATCC 36951]